MELKLPIIYTNLAKNPSFYSNQCGIETYLKVVSGSAEGAGAFYSNQCGIETVEAYQTAHCLAAASTRTNVELKPNLHRCERAWLHNFYSNQCGIETLNSCGQITIAHHLLLEPMWNWNFPRLLVPHTGISFYSNQCGIETGSRGAECVCANYYFYSNQCGIETKPTIQQWIGISLLLLEPMWNWNPPRAPPKATVSIASTRTNVELKPLIHNTRLIWFVNFYSNQCGIETNGNHRVWDRRRSSSTRTNVELKPICASYSTAKIGIFYSNQCGIETELTAKFCRNWARLLLEPMWNWNR